MLDWESCKNFVWVWVIPLLFGVFWLIKKLAETKSVLPKRAKPRLLDAQNCKINKDLITAGCDLLIDNVGSKNCSIISIDLVILEKLKVDFFNARTTLPKSISIDSTERIEFFGLMNFFWLSWQW